MNDEYIRQKHRHPVGTWIIFKDKTYLRHVKVHSDISIRYTLGKRSLPHGKILAKGRLEKIIEYLTSKHGMYFDDISYSIIRKKENKSYDVIISRTNGGRISTMLKVGKILLVLYLKCHVLGIWWFLRAVCNFWILLFLELKLKKMWLNLEKILFSKY